jgi:arylsulfatase
VPGSSHASHHPTKEWVEKIHAMHLFDDGYEKLRERIFANQKKLGVIPQDEELTPWPSDLLKPWDKLSPEEKKLYIRQVEVFAIFRGLQVRGFARRGQSRWCRLLLLFRDRCHPGHG